MGNQGTVFSRTALAIALVMTTRAPLWPQSPAASSGAPQSYSQGPPDWQRAAGGKMAFVTASVKQNTTAPARASYSNFPLGPGDVYFPNRGVFRAGNHTLATYIIFAYKITPSMEQLLLSQLPKWATADRFDIQAKAEGNPTKDQMRLMMQTLLADRFRLVVHYETRQLPVLVLVMDQPGKLGPLLQQHVDDSPCPTTPEAPSPAPMAPPQTVDMRFPITCGGVLDMVPSAPGRTRAGARNVSMELIASSLMGGPNGPNRPILDRTGLTGRFDVALEYSPEGKRSSPPSGNVQPEPRGPTFAEALKEQLGLRLETQTAPVDFLLVDYVDQLSPN
jgi:uncharacterized protein (TIGR03435 family)